MVIETKLGGEGDPLGVVKEAQIWPYKQMEYRQLGVCPEKWETQNFLGFWNTKGSPNLWQTTRPSENQQK